MRVKSLAFAAILAFACAPVVAANPSTAALSAQTTKAEVERLLEVMDMQTMMGGMMQQMADVQRTMLADAFGKNASDKQAAMQTAMDRTNAIIQKDFSWTTLEPVIINVYMKVFTPDEVRAMTAFYSSPVGASILKKSPQVMALTMQELQPLMMSVVEKMKLAISDDDAPSKK